MPRDKKGYTFIEITVVVLLIGLMMALTLPRFRYAVLTDNLKTATRRLVGMIKTIRNEAVREQQGFVLYFDLESNRFWPESSEMTEEERFISHEKASSLPSGVRILDIWLNGKGKKVANAFLGPLASRYKWSVAVFPESRNVRVKVSKSMTGRWGGALGARKVKKELNRLAVKMKALPSEFMN